MKAFSLFSISLVIVLSTCHIDAFTRDDFPEDFLFGAATSAYQWEGGVAEHGRTPSVWDTFSHSYNKVNGDIACDGYHKYKMEEDLLTQKVYGFTRASSKNYEPMGSNHTLHFTTMIFLRLLKMSRDEGSTAKLYFCCREDFTAFADVCFREFGDDVKLWTTVNEANTFAIGAYGQGILPPGHCSPTSFHYLLYWKFFY